MAQIDVSDLLLDPDFVDPISIIRRTSSVNSFGENVTTELAIFTVGSIQPASSNTISRLPEALRMADVRDFFIKIEIIQDGATLYPDVLIFQNIRYQVQTAAPWLNYGRGWNVGTCVKEKPSL